MTPSDAAAPDALHWWTARRLAAAMRNRVLSARDVMGYTFVVFLALVPVVLLLVTLLGATLPYPL